MINEIGHIISKYNQMDALFSQVIDILRKRLDYDRGLILLTGRTGATWNSAPASATLRASSTR